jgi:uncharacterized protein (TIGR03437 family)
MKPKTLLIVALVCFGALSLVLSTSAQRQVALPDARASAQAAQSPAGQNRAARQRPETRENFDARADHSNSLDAPFDAAQTVEPGQQSLAAAQTRPAVRYKLQRERPGLQMKWSSLTQTPSRIWSFSESLTPPVDADAEAIARSFLKDNTDLFQLAGGEVDDLRVARRYRTDHNGVTHVTLGQWLDGIEVFQADLAVHVDRAGAVIAASGELMPGAARKVNLAQPKMAAAEALRLAAQDVEAEVTGPLNLSAPPTGVEARQKFGAAAGFERDVDARLVYFPLTGDQLRLAWEFILWMRETPDVYLMVVDAERGSLLYRYNFTNYDENPLRPHGPVFTKDSPRPNAPYTGNANPAVVQREDLPFRAAPFNGREIFAVADQHYDWWAGIPANNLISNNTNTYLDRDGTPGQPDQPRLSAPDGNFSFPVDFTQAPTTENNQRAAQVNLFYWINRYHDILYSFGFNEAAGNFQTNNFNLGGRGADAILGEAQDGSGTNNANFSSPPDGSPGRVQMYLFTTANPQLDGDFDQGIIIHELTHGLSTRLVFNSSGLSGLQAGGMGEGWSDYFGLVLLRSEADDLNGTYPVGQYATTNQARGIRRFPYSTNPSVFPLTYKDVALRNQVHALGEIWCNTLLEMRALLIQRYGFQEGQRQSIQLVVDGLKLTPRAPTFIDARNAILLADRVNNRSANQCLLWQAFSKRGLGFWASSTDSSDGAPTESLENAPYCSDAGTVRLDKGHYLSNENVRITLGDRNALAAQRVIVTSSVTGDEEVVTLAQEAGIPGSFNGLIRLGSGRARRGDGVLQGSSEVADQIVVTYSDANNGSDPATVRTIAAFAREKALFEDEVEIGNQGWLPSGTWAVTNARAASPTRSWTDSPAGNYPANSNTTLTSPLFDLSGLSEVTLNFAHSYSIESGFDFGIIEFSTDDGITWKRAVAYTGAQPDFAPARVRLPALDGQARARVRFRLASDVSIVADGWYVDDIRLTGRSVSPAIIPPGGAAPPAITSVTPAFGPPGGGTRVTILGANFTETDDTTVTFDNLPAGLVTVVSGSVITAVAPPHAAGAVNVSVRNRQGSVSLVKGFTYYTAGSASGAPTLTSVYPTFGSIRGGTVVTLVGANFTPESVVLFGSTPATPTFINSNTLRVAPPAVPAPVTVDVVAGNGLAGSRLSGAFNYINPTPPVVEILSPAGGETFFTGSTVNIRWRSSDNRAVARHRLSLRRPSGLGFTLVDLATNIEGSAQSYAWTIPANFAGFEGHLRILATDDEGTETEVYSDGAIAISRRWEPSASLPLNSLVFFAAAGDGRYVYALGGRNVASPDPATPVARRLDSTAASPVWTEIAPMPVALANAKAVFLRGKIYVPGGVNVSNQLAADHLAYDVATNTWATAAAVPVPSTNYALVADDARGVYYYTSAAGVRAYDPAANTWTTLPSMNGLRLSHEAALIEGRLYVAGGNGATGGLTSAEVFDFSARQWTPIAPMNRPRINAVNYLARDTSGNPLWVIVGGQDTTTGAAPPPEAYDVRNNRWIQLDNSFNLTLPRALAGGATVGNFFYVVGGAAPVGGNVLQLSPVTERTRTDTPISPIPLNPVPPALAVPAAQIAVAGVEVKFNVTANDLGSGAPLSLTARNLPPGANFTTTADTNNSVRGAFRWTPAAGDVGRTFTVSFTAGDSSLSETKQVTIRVVEASRLTAVNSADFRLGPVAADSIATIFGVNLAVRSDAAQGSALPLELAGTTVTINGVQAPLFAVSPTQINLAIPASVEPGQATIIVSNPAGSYAAGTVEIAQAAPALFTLNSAGTGDAYALATIDGVNYQQQPFDVLVGGRPNVVVFFATGVRRATAANPNDENGVAESAAVTIDGRPARVLYAGAQGDFAGLDQLNVEMPAALAGGGLRRVEVVVTVNGVAANRVTIQVR